jgi:RimJ/RimL family protein N-acetyltransferase
MKALFRTDGCVIKMIEEDAFQKVLGVYQQAEDFLSLGPVPHASIEMVHMDIRHSRESGGLFCMILDNDGNHIGVIDFIPETSQGTAFLSLLMLSQSHRRRGIGQAIIRGLELYLHQKYGTHTIESGVQTNNAPAIGFWKRCGFVMGNVAKAQDDGTVTYDMKKGPTLIP